MLDKIVYIGKMKFEAKLRELEVSEKEENVYERKSFGDLAKG